MLSDEKAWPYKLLGKIQKRWNSYTIGSYVEKWYNHFED